MWYLRHGRWRKWSVWPERYFCNPTSPWSGRDQRLVLHILCKRVGICEQTKRNLKITRRNMLWARVGKVALNGVVSLLYRPLPSHNSHQAHRKSNEVCYSRDRNCYNRHVRICVHAFETECQRECCFQFLRCCYIIWIEVPILTSLESVLIEWMHLNFVNDVVAVITLQSNSIHGWISEFCRKITIIKREKMVNRSFRFRFRMWLRRSARRAQQWLCSHREQTSNWNRTSYRVSRVCNHGTFWTSIRAIGEYSSRRT